MITVEDDCEFTILVADLIKTLALFDKKLFELDIWVSGCELPLTFENSCDFHFMQEGVRIIRGNIVEYVFYDVITYVKVISKELK